MSENQRNLTFLRDKKGNIGLKRVNSLRKISCGTTECVKITLGLKH